MADYTVHLRISATSEDAAIDLVRGKLSALGREQAETATKTRALEGAVSGLRSALSALGAAVGVGALVTFFRSSAQAAIENEQANTNLLASVRDLTQATAEDLSTLLPWMGALEQASGLTNEQLTPGVLQLAAVTKDLAQTHAFVEVAAGAAARGLGTFEGNVSALVRLLATGAVRGVDAFAVQLKEAAKDGKLTAAEIENLHRKYGDAGAAVDTAAQQVRRAQVAWDNTKEAVGNLALVLEPVLVPALKGVSYAIGTVIAGTIKWGAHLMMIPAEASAMAGSLVVRMKEGADAQQRFLASELAHRRSILAAADAEAQKILDGITEAWSTGTAGVSKGAKAAGQAFGEGINLGAEEAALEAVEAMQKIREAFASAATGSSDDALKESSAVLENYLKGLQVARREDLESASNRVSSEGRTWQALRKVQAQGLRGLRADELRSRRDTLMQILLMQKTNAAQRKEILAELAATEIEIEKEKAAAQTQVNMEVAANFLGAASALFGNNKALAIASTVIQTWAGAQAAFAETPGPVWVKAAAAAAAVLAGMARVKSIQETDFKKGGFDIPTNDAAAYDVGQRWGEKWGGDMLSFLDRGITAGFAGRLAGIAFRGPAQAHAPTFNNYHTQNSRGATIHQHVSVIGGFAGEAQLRALEKLRRRASRAYDRSIVSRRVTRIGSVRTT